MPLLPESRNPHRTQHVVAGRTALVVGVALSCSSCSALAAVRFVVLEDEAGAEGRSAVLADETLTMELLAHRPNSL